MQKCQFYDYTLEKFTERSEVIMSMGPARVFVLVRVIFFSSILCMPCSLSLSGRAEGNRSTGEVESFSRNNTSSDILYSTTIPHAAFSALTLQGVLKQLTHIVR